MQRINFTESTLTTLKQTARCSFANAVYKLTMKAQQGLKCDDLYKKSVLMNDVQKLLCNYKLDTCISFHPGLEGGNSTWTFGLGSFTGTISYYLNIDGVNVFIGAGDSAENIVTDIINNSDGTGVTASLDDNYITITSPVGCFVKTDLYGIKDPVGTIPATQIIFLTSKCPQEETCVDYSEEDLNCITPQDLQTLYEFTHKYKETLAKSTKKISNPSKTTSNTNSSDCCTWGSIGGNIGNQSDLVTYLANIEKNYISVEDEGTEITNDLKSINFIGDGVNATDDGNGNVTVDITGGGGGSGVDGIDGANSRRWEGFNTENVPSYGNISLRNSANAVTFTPSSGASIRVSQFDNTSANMQNWFTALNTYRTTNPGKAYIQITKSNDNSIFGIYQIGNMSYNNVIPSFEYWSIGLTYISGGGTFSISDTITLSWVLFGADGNTGTTPDLQQVLDAGNTSTTSLGIVNGLGESVEIKPNQIKIVNTLAAEASITSPNLTTSTTFEIPDKSGTQTFAMLSDLTSGGVASVNSGTNINVDNTDPANPIINSLSDRYNTTSVTSNTIGNGSKTFTVDANLAYIPLQEVLVVYDSSNHMHGTVTSYNPATGALVVDIKNHTGSGTYTLWSINLDGTPVDAITGSGTANRLAYFTAAQVIDDLDTATYPSLTELSYVKGVGSQVVGATDTNTLTNKRITARTGTVASSATPTINTDNVDFYSITALATAITSMTTNLSGTPTDAQTLWIAITDNGTARAITWGASFEASTIALPTTTVISTRLDVAFIWNTATSKWRCVGVA